MITKLPYFNSSVVRLKDAKDAIGSFVDRIFQFQCGAIKSNFFMQT